MDATRHQCMIYEGSPSKHLPGIASLIAEKLKAHFRCLYLNTPAMIAGIRSYLAAAGVDVAHEVKRGALVLSADQGHLNCGQFDTEQMLVLLSAAIDCALSDGYRGLFAIGDMTWEFGPENNFQKLSSYEQKLEELFVARPELEGICLYHTDTLPVEAPLEALRNHHTCRINQTLSLINSAFAASTSQPLVALPVGHLEKMLAKPVEQTVS